MLKYKTNDATKLFLLDDFDKVLSLDLIKKADEVRKRAAAAAKPTAGVYSILAEDGSEDAEVTAKIQARYEAKKAKNFAEADRVKEAKANKAATDQAVKDCQQAVADAKVSIRFDHASKSLIIRTGKE